MPLFVYRASFQMALCSEISIWGIFLFRGDDNSGLLPWDFKVVTSRVSEYFPGGAAFCAMDLAFAVPCSLDENNCVYTGNVAQQLGPLLVPFLPTLLGWMIRLCLGVNLLPT